MISEQEHKQEESLKQEDKIKPCESIKNQRKRLKFGIFYRNNIQLIDNNWDK